VSSRTTAGPASRTDAVEVDSARLESLGYESGFDRSLSTWQNFALGFTYLSPVVGAYGLFNIGLSAGGPPMIWSYLLAGAGQMLVCLIFGEVVSQYPIAGGVYPWARRLAGRRWSWMVGWVYGWAMFATIAGVAASSGPVLGGLFVHSVSNSQQTLISLALLALTTTVNLSGTRTVARIAMVGFVCEITGALLIGTYLLVFHRHQPLSAVIDSFGALRHGSYVQAFLSSLIVGMFCCYGFEACGDVAEETASPSVAIPRAMRMTIYVGISVCIFAVLALILAVPNMSAAVLHPDADTLATVIESAFGSSGARVISLVVLVSYISCCLSLQAAASRLLYSFGRDRMVMFSAPLGRLSPKHHVPHGALLAAGVIPGLMISMGFWVGNLLQMIVNFASVGIYVSFQMVVVAALYARFRGWIPNGAFRLGGWAWAVNVLALVYGVAAIVNMAWPRLDGSPWYVNHAVTLTTAAIVGIGLLYLYGARPDQNSNAPASDAWKAPADTQR
jgi:amino acid transporter